MKDTSEKLQSFSALKGPGSPTEEAIKQGLTLYKLFQENGFQETDAFLGQEGEIRVTAYQGTLYIEATVETDRTITLVKEEGKEPRKETILTPEQVSCQMEWIKKWTSPKVD
jgi:hypothetical protein